MVVEGIHGSSEPMHLEDNDDDGDFNDLITNAPHLLGAEIGLLNEHHTPFPLRRVRTGLQGQGHHSLKLLGLVRRAKVTLPGVTNGELVET
eukprot:1156183-Pelagomonas_calceolata.AAC.15